MNPIDYLIVVTYFLAILSLGLFAGKNVNSVKAFAIADKSYPTWLIVATLLATGIGAGSLLGTAEKVFTDGIVYLFILLGYPISKFIIAKYICPRIQDFKGKISAGEIMGSFYGISGQVITGISGILLSIGFISAQVSAIGYLFYFLLGISHFYGILIGCFIIVFYSSFGGIRSIALTNTIQFMMLSIGVLLICYLPLKNIGGISNLPLNPLEEIAKISSFNIDSLKNLGLFLVFCLPFVGPAFIQRMLMAKDASQATKTVYLTAIFEVFFYFIFSCIGLLALSLKPNLDPSLIVSFLIDYQPAVIKGICIVGMFSIVISSADAEINVASIALVHDVIKPLANLSGYKILESTELSMMRISVFLFGAVAIVISSSFKSIFDIIIGALDFWGPIILIPFFAGVLGLKASTKTFIYSVVAGITTVLVWNLFIQEEAHLVESLAPAVLANLLVFFISYYSEKRRGSISYSI